jgi:excisionase family DNA binding protein
VTDEPNQPRFLTPTQVAEELNVKPNQVHALIKAGKLRAFQVGGRGMWRIGLHRAQRVRVHRKSCTSAPIGCRTMYE